MTNAVIHRDYPLSGNNIKISIFDDILEIKSPDPLPDKDELELEIFKKLRALFTLNVKLTFYDITSTFSIQTVAP